MAMLEVTTQRMVWDGTYNEAAYAKYVAKCAAGIKKAAVVLGNPCTDEQAQASAEAMGRMYRHHFRNCKPAELDTAIRSCADPMHPYKVRMRCGHVEERQMTAATAGTAYDPSADWQIDSQADCANCLKVKAEVRARQQPPKEGELHSFYPEMYEEKAESRIFFSRYVHNCYSLEWAASRDEEARAILKQHRVRPKSLGAGKDPFSLSVPGKDYHGKVAKWSILITYGAHEKLRGYITHEMLLD